MTKERPILFSTPMVQAILQGRKTQTRRVVKHHQVNGTPAEYSGRTLLNTKMNGKQTKEYGALFRHETYPEIVKWVKCPYGKPGDLLWVRETWFLTQPTHPEAYHYGYKAGGIMPYSDWEASEKYDFETPDVLKPSIHMPKDAARIWLRITDVRVERLHDISEIDAAREGLLNSTIDADRTAKLWFYYLWKSIHGPGSLEKNPWVWVLSFEVLSTNGRKEANP